MFGLINVMCVVYILHCHSPDLCPIAFANCLFTRTPIIAHFVPQHSVKSRGVTGKKLIRDLEVITGQVSRGAPALHQSTANDASISFVQQFCFLQLRRGHFSRVLFHPLHSGAFGSRNCVSRLATLRSVLVRKYHSFICLVNFNFSHGVIFQLVSWCFVASATSAWIDYPANPIFTTLGSAQGRRHECFAHSYILYLPHSVGPPLPPW